MFSIPVRQIDLLFLTNKHNSKLSHYWIFLPSIIHATQEANALPISVLLDFQCNMSFCSCFDMYRCTFFLTSTFPSFPLLLQCPEVTRNCGACLPTSTPGACILQLWCSCTFWLQCSGGVLRHMRRWQEFKSIAVTPDCMAGNEAISKPNRYLSFLLPIHRSLSFLVKHPLWFPVYLLLVLNKIDRVSQNVKQQLQI